jgi:sugar transferase (PEP-CTERM system associated)
MTLANAVVAVAYIAAGLAVGLYETETLRHRSRIAVRSLLTIGLATAIAYVLLHTLMYEIYSRRIAIISPLTFIALSGGLRLLACRAMRNLKSRILFVGYGDSIRRISEAVTASEAGRNYVLLGYVAGSESDQPGATDLPRLGGIEDVQAVCLAEDVQEVVIGTEESSDAELSQLIMCCLRMGCRVTNQPTFHERVLGEVPADHISADWFLFADLEGHRAGRASIKRVFDFSFSALTLLITLPLWPLIALAVKLSGAGPVFYSQERVGRHNRIFRLIKFRTMRPDAEVDGHMWSTPGDPRVTRVGRFLRRAHLDELPQLWNIFLGDMSIVGPRPERPEFVRELISEIPYYDERHLVKPGLTGWAQINYRYGCTVEDARRKLFLDLYYIKQMSLELDLVIIFRTLGILIRHPI